MIRDDTSFGSLPHAPLEPPEAPSARDAFARGERDGLDLLERLPAPEAEAELGIRFSELPVLALMEAAQQLRLAQEEERRLAPRAATQLERQPEIRARLLIDNHQRFRTWGLAEELLERCHHALFQADSCRAVRIARLAVTVAGRIDDSIYGASLTADLLARCWGSLGNAYRCSGQLEAASSAFERADEALMDGTGDPLEEATLLGYRASWATAVGDYEDSVALLEDTRRIYEELGEDHLLARTLVKLSTPHGFLDPSSGAETARRAEKLLDPHKDSRLFLMARHNHIRFVIDAGNPEHAAMLLKGSRKYYRRESTRWIQLNLAWTEARLAAALGDLAEAEAGYEVLLTEMLEHRYRVDGALVALDLAATRISLGKFREAAELTARMAHYLAEGGAHSRARSAWSLLQHALDSERATIDLVRQVAFYVHRCWNNPKAPFSRELQRELRRQGGD